MNRRTALMLTMLGGLVPQSLPAQSGGRKSSKMRDKAFAPVSRDDERMTMQPPAMKRPPRFHRSPASSGSGTRFRDTQPPRATRPFPPRRRSSTGSSSGRGWRSGTVIRSPCSLRPARSSALTTHPTCSSRSTRLSSASPTPSKTFCRFTSNLSPRSIPVGDTRSSTGSLSWAAAPRANRSGRCALMTQRLVLSQMQVQQGFRKLADQRVEMINGQTLTIKTSEPRRLCQRSSARGWAGAGFQSRADKIEESVNLKLSPLLNFEGDATDAMIDLTVNTVRSFHRTRVITPRDTGASRNGD